MRKFLITFFFVFSIYCFNLYSWQLEQDTITSVRIDTLGLNKPSSKLGSYPDSLIADKLDKNKIVVGDFLSVYEFIQEETFFRFLTFGSLGNSPLVNLYGVISYPEVQQNSIRNSFLPNNFSSFELIPVLSVDRVEVLSGSSADVLGKNSNGILFNFRTRNFNTKVPYTQIWIGQGGYEYLGSSGLFSQNVAKNLNFHFLYQRFWSAGRYDNSNSDRWNVIFGVRWFPNSKLNLYFENKYSIVNNALYGGLNPERSTILFDNTFSAVNFENLNRKSSQNDLSLNFLYSFVSDTSIFLDGNFLFSYSRNEFEFENYYAEHFQVQKSSKYTSNSLIINSKLNFVKSDYKLLLGIDVEKRNQKKWLFVDSRPSLEPLAFALLQINLVGNLKFQIGSRISNQNSDFLYALGSKFCYSFDSTTSVYLDLSSTKKNMIELFSHSHLAILGFSLWNVNFKLQTEIFGRLLTNFKQYELRTDSLGNLLEVAKTSKDYNLSVFGSNLLISFSILKGLRYHLKANLNYFVAEKERKEWMPVLDMSNSLSYRFSRGESYIDIGIEFELFSPFKGLYFHPLYPYPVEFEVRRGWQNNGLNAFATAKLGNAFVNVSLRNILSTNFYLLPIYPEYDRNIRINVFWSFND